MRVYCMKLSDEGMPARVLLASLKILSTICKDLLAAI